MEIETVDLWSGDEWIPVELITENTGIIKSIPMNPEFGYGDMVILDFEEKEISQVINKKSKTAIYTYEIPYNSLDVNWDKIEAFFKKQKLHIQKHEEGLFLLAVPLKYSDENLEDMLNQCPVKCFKVDPKEIYDPEEDDDDDDDGFFHLN